ncbi:hypothetical protein NSERUTF1_3505 [Nocardia seriolae]|nr:hypothetical protein NSERUTF1_3505 [Nocardia seriolae]
MRIEFEVSRAVDRRVRLGAGGAGPGPPVVGEAAVRAPPRPV